MIMNISNETAGPPTTTPDVGLLQQTQYRVYDGMLAMGFWSCLVIGLPGNCLALGYFIQTKNWNLPTLLYITACCIDIVSSVIHFPVAVNLLNQRNPGLLGDVVFCKAWFFLLLSLQLMSMFVVMLLSLSRAIVILVPFYKIKKRNFLLSIPVVLLYYSAWNGWYIFLGKYYYSYAVGYCETYNYSNELMMALYMINCSVVSGAPPAIVFVSMVVAIAKLKGSKLPRASQRNNRQASLTIIYFAALYLVCNFLTFVNNSLYTYIEVANPVSGYPGPMYRSTFMFFYSWLISEIFCTVLNASLNPILYLWRMREMRMWGLKLFKGEETFDPKK